VAFFAGGTAWGHGIERPAEVRDFVRLWSMAGCMGAADERDATDAYYVGYRGTVGYQPRSWGKPRHGHRFVRDPRPGETAWHQPGN
jgi:hypothetical protein